MPYFPRALWQQFPDGCGSARFSLAMPEETGESPLQSGAVPLESLRADVVVELLNRLTSASIEHPQLAPFLMDGLDSALEHLSQEQNEGYLRELQWWLCHDDEL